MSEDIASNAPHLRLTVTPPDPYYVAPASRSLPVGGWGVFSTNDEGGHWLFWHSTREGAQARADAMNRRRRAPHQTIAEARARGPE
jgi:hypothetical protein